ncbi:glycosyltransferase family 4 protein (plasmid) [Deinococcus radiomollis]|uniref:glycosyltransferase family 4 protein n=1 Tax=Deinococcus radiomollis TaxID=468916 RepID=UPI003891F283
MRLTAVLEQRFDRTPDGRVWTPGPHGYPFWERYLTVFSEVRVVARVRDVPALTGSLRPANGPGVVFAAVPHFLGPLGFLRQYLKVRRAIGRAVRDPQAGVVLLRVPGTLSSVASAALGRRPFAAEVVGDPYDQHAPGVRRHPLQAFFRRSYTRQMTEQCKRSSVTAYVTSEALQRRYPTSGQAFALSDVDLPPEAYAARPKVWHPEPHEAVMVCTLELNIKGVDAAISAVRVLRDRGRNVRLRIVGDGLLRPQFEKQAADLGLAGQVLFVGAVAGGEAVRAQLDQCDVFLMPSRQEGLPRAMVEAMARGLPALGSEIGGIPELLGPDERFTLGPADQTHADALQAETVADALQRLLGDPARYDAQGARNLEVSRAYANSALADTRLRFYQAVRDLGERSEKPDRRTRDSQG